MEHNTTTDVNQIFRGPYHAYQSKPPYGNEWGVNDSDGRTITVWVSREAAEWLASQLNKADSGNGRSSPAKPRTNRKMADLGRQEISRGQKWENGNLNAVNVVDGGAN